MVNETGDHIEEEAAKVLVDQLSETNESPHSDPIDITVTSEFIQPQPKQKSWCKDLTSLTAVQPAQGDVGAGGATDLALQSSCLIVTRTEEDGQLVKHGKGRLHWPD